MTAMRDELLRLVLLWKEGLLCRCCHGELATRDEIETGICLACIRLEELTELDVTAPEGGDSCL